MPRWLPLLLIALLALAACEAEDEEVTEDEDVAEEDEDPAEDDEDYSVEDQPDDAAAMFVAPEDGDTVSSPFTVELDVENFELAEAGDPVVGEGHLHVLVDMGCLEEGELIPGPSDDAEAEGYWHLGDGSTEREIDLEPGDYELCVQIGDGPHTSFGEGELIEVTVE